MKRVLSFAVLLLPLAAMACQAETTPPDFPAGQDETVENTPELADYDIDPGEYVATEGDPELETVWPRVASGEEGDFIVDEVGDPGAPLEPELEEQDNSVAFEDAQGAQGVGPTGLGGGSLRLLADKTLPTWWTRTFPIPFKVKNDPRNRAGARICRGSPYNCPAPNPHADANRLHPKSAIEEYYRTRDMEKYERTGWKIQPDTRMYEGGGTEVNVLKSDGAPLLVNFGIRRELMIGGKNEVVLYVWSAQGTKGQTSGWVKKRDFVYQSGDEFDRATQKDFSPRKPRDKDLVEETRFLRTAENLGPCKGPTFDARPTSNCFDSFNDAKKKKTGLDKFSELKVVPNETGTNGKVGDYLMRNKGVLNLASATPRLGGPSTETRVVKEGDVFRRLVSKDRNYRRLLAVPLFKAKSKVVVGKMLFAYGHWNGRYGWMALDALRVKSDKAGVAGPEAPGCEGKADGLYCLGASAYECTGGTPGRNVSCADATKACVSGADGKASLDSEGKLVCQ